MALPTSGLITATMIREELKESGAWRITSDSSRKLAKVPSGTIKLTDFYGKSAREETLLNGVFMGGAGFYAGFIFNKTENPGTSITPEFISIGNQKVRVETIHGYSDETSNNVSIELDWPDLTLLENKILKFELYSEESKTKFKGFVSRFWMDRNKIIGIGDIQEALLFEIPEFTRSGMLKMSINIIVQEANSL